MRELTPANAGHDEPVLLTASSGLDLAAHPLPVQAQSMGGQSQQFDQLASELKTLRQQALSTQAGIEQLQTSPLAQADFSVFAERPVTLGSASTVLGIGVLILGCLLWWNNTRRSRFGSIESHAEFVDSYCPPDALSVQSPLTFREQARVIAAALPAPSQTLISKPQLSLSPALGNSDSVLDDEHDTSPITDPTAQPVPDAQHAGVILRDPAPEFDPTAAAGEVERVLKSLASKRAARLRWPQEAPAHLLAPQGKAAMDVLGLDAAANARVPGAQHAGDLASDPGLGQRTQSIGVINSMETVTHEPVPSSLTLASNVAALSPFNARPMADLQASVPAWPTSDQIQVASPEPDHEVRLLLAREFEALGLTQGARELATEVLGSNDVSISVKAIALLHQIDAKESSQQLMV